MRFPPTSLTSTACCRRTRRLMPKLLPQSRCRIATCSLAIPGPTSKTRHACRAAEETSKPVSSDPLLACGADGIINLAVASRNAATTRQRQQYRTSDCKCTFIDFKRAPEAPVRATDRHRSSKRGGCKHLNEVVNVAQSHSCSCSCPCSRKFRAFHQRICPKQ